MGPLCFDYGYGPFRWVCLSGKPEDLQRTDHAAMSCIDPSRRGRRPIALPGVGGASVHVFRFAGANPSANRRRGRRNFLPCNSLQRISATFTPWMSAVRVRHRPPWMQAPCPCPVNLGIGGVFRFLVSPDLPRWAWSAPPFASDHPLGSPRRWLDIGSGCGTSMHEDGKSSEAGEFRMSVTIRQKAGWKSDR